MPLDQKKQLVFLLAGQSNMDGRGDGSQLTTVDRQRLAAVQDRVTLYYNKEAARPLGTSIPKKHTARKFQLDTVFGPELFFGIEMAEAFPNQEIVLIKRSQGGTSLYGCWNPNWTVEKAQLMNEDNQPQLFNDFIAYSQEILQQWTPENYHLVGMLWVQGETDSGKRFGPEPATTYGENLSQLIAAVRQQFNQPKLPFLLLQVGSGEVVKGMRRVAQADPLTQLIPQEKDTSSEFYYPGYGPPVGHYNYEGMKRIGTHFFNFFPKGSI